MLAKHRHLVGDLVCPTDQVAFVRVPCGDWQGALLASAPDHDWNASWPNRRGEVHGVNGRVIVAAEGDPFTADHRSDDLHRFVEAIEPRLERAVVKPVCSVFELEPAASDAEHCPAFADHIKGRDRLGQQRRVAVRVTRDQGRQCDLGRSDRQGTEQAVALEHVVLGRPEHRQLVEVVHDQDRVPARLFGGHRLVCHGVKELIVGDAVIVEIGDLKSEAHGRPFWLRAMRLAFALVTIRP